MPPSLRNALPDWSLVDPNAPVAQTNAPTAANVSALDQDPMRFAMGPAPGLAQNYAAIGMSPSGNPIAQQGPTADARDAAALGSAGVKYLPPGVGARMPLAPTSPGAGVNPGSIQFMQPQRGAMGPTSVKVKAQDVPLTNPKNLTDKQAVNQEAQENIEAQKGDTLEAGQDAAAMADLQARGKSELARVGAEQFSNDQKFAAKAEQIGKDYDAKLAASTEAMNKNRPQSFDEWFGNKSTIDQVRYWISGVLGGALMGLQHRDRNPMLDNLNKAFESEVQREKEEYERAKDSRDNVRSSYAEAMRQFGNERDASRAALSDKYTALQQQLDATATAYGAPNYMQNARAANTLLDARKIQIRDQAVDNNIRLNKYIPEHTVTVGGAAQPKQTNSLIFESPDGKRYVAANRMSRNALAEQSGAVSEVKALAQKLDALRSQGATFVPGTQENADAKVVGAQLQNAIREAGNMGVFKEADLPMFEMMLGDPTSLFSRSGRKSLDVADMVGQKFNDRLRAEAAEQVDHDYGVDPKTGQVVPVNPYAMSSPSKRGAMPTAQSAQSAGFEAAGKSQEEQDDKEDVEDRK